MEFTELEEKYIRKCMGKRTPLKIASDIAVNVEDIKKYCKINKINTVITYKSVDINYYVDKYDLSEKEINYIYNNIFKHKKELANEMSIDEKLLLDFLEEYRENKNSKLHSIIKEVIDEKFDKEEDVVDYIRKQLETKSTLDLGEEFGVNCNTISRYCYLNEIRIVQKTNKKCEFMTEEEKEKCVEYIRKYHGIKSWNTIVKYLNRSKTTLQTLITRNSIKKNKSL